jgi:hypothetical protein
MTQFTHYSVEKNNASPLIAKMGISFDGANAAFDITGNGSFIPYSQTPKTPLQIQIYQNIADSVSDVPFSGILTVFGANDDLGTGKTKLGDFAVNLGIIDPAQPIFSFDLNGGLGVKARRWDVSWKAKTQGVKVTLMFDDGTSKNTSTIGLENTVGFDLTTPAKATSISVELTETATVTSLTDSFVVSYDLTEVKPELGGVSVVKTHKYNSSKLAITKTVPSGAVLKGNLVRAIDLDKTLIEEKIRIGEAIETKEMITLFSKSKDEALKIYNGLVSGATYGDLLAMGIQESIAMRSVGVFYMHTNTEQTVALNEQTKFAGLKQKTPAEILTAMQTAGVSLPNLDQFIAQNRALLTEQQRTALFTALGIAA